MSAEYGADQIQILEGLEAVRKRPGMYIGRYLGRRGLHHLVYEIVDNAVDEALAGYCHNIVCDDQSRGTPCTVVDDGRGYPGRNQQKGGSSAVEVVFTVHACRRENSAEEDIRYPEDCMAWEHRCKCLK